MKFLKNLVSKIVAFFTSGKAEAALNAAVALVPKAVPIVQTIAALTPNKADDEIAAAFAHYAMPFSQEYLAAPRDQRGYLLLHLATSVLAEEAPGVATNVLNTAIQLAVTGVKAG
jgi:hypothetical protein